MTAIFTRNLAIFVLCALLAKYPFEFEREKPFRAVVQNYPAKNIHKPDYSSLEHEKSCLSASTSFPIADTNLGSRALPLQGVPAYILDNTVGSVNITCSDGYIYNKQTELWHIANTIPLTDIVSENKIIIKVNTQDSEILNQRMKETTDIGHIVNGTVLEEIYIIQGIDRIEKIELYSEGGYFYTLELASGEGSASAYGERFLSNIDNLRRFFSR